jgi:hypothetical protein
MSLFRKYPPLPDEYAKMHGLTKAQFCAGLRETMNLVLDSPLYHKLYAMVEKKRSVPLLKQTQLSWGKFTNNRLQFSYEKNLLRERHARKKKMSSDRWFIPADFMYGSEQEDYGRTWPQCTPDELDAWMQFTMQILRLTGQHDAGHEITVSLEKLSEEQIQCALSAFHARGWPVSRDGQRMRIQSKSPN